MSLHRRSKTWQRLRAKGPLPRIFETLESRVMLDAWDDISSIWDDIPDASNGVDLSPPPDNSYQPPDYGSTDNSQGDPGTYVDTSGADTYDSYDNSGNDQPAPEVGHRPSAPVNLTAQAPTATSIYLSWTNTSGNQSRVKVKRFGPEGTWQTVATLKGNATHFTDSGLLTGTQYSYAVVAANSDGSSDYSNIATLTTEDDADPTLIGRFGHLPGGRAAVPFSFFDGDGTAVEITLSGPGSGEIHLNPGGYDLTLVDTTLATAVSIVTRRAGADDGRFAVHDVTVGLPGDALDHTALGTLTAPTTDLAGALTITGPAKSLSLGDMTGETVQIGAPAVAPRTPVAVSLSFGRITDSAVKSAIGIKSFSAIDWTDTDAATNPDAIDAPSLGALKITGRKRSRQLAAVAGDFQAEVNLSGAAKGLTLGSASVGHQISGVWQIDGAVGTIAAKSAGQWTLAVGDVGGAAGSVKSLALSDAHATNSGLQIDAASIGTLTVKGNMDQSDLTLRQPPDKKHAALGSFSVGGILSDSRLRSAGNIGTIRAGVLDHSLIFAGVGANVAGLPAASDFAAPVGGVFASIGKLTLAGVRGQVAALIDSDIAAPSIARVTLPRGAGVVLDTDLSTAFGFATLQGVGKYVGRGSSGLYLSGVDSVVG